VVAQPKKVPIQKKRGRGGLYLLLGLVAVAVVAGLALTRGQPRPDTFDVDPAGPPVTVEGYVLGDPNAPVEVLEWADFECPACMQFATLTEPDVRQRLVSTGQVRFRYFFFPLPNHRSSASAAYAAACAADQNKFWEMHDALYAGFNDWAQGRARDPKGVFRGYAERIGLDVGTWESCYESDKHRQLITQHKAMGIQRGVGSTPTFIIGGKQVPGAISYDAFKAHVDSAAATAGAAAPAAAPAATPASTAPAASDSGARR
jgi:protein-disulfide isomerase